MRAKAFSLVLLGLVLAAAILVQIQAPLTNREVLISEQEARPAPAAVPEAAKPRVVAAYGKLPLSFEANQGQTDSEVKFLSRGRGYTLFLTGDEAVLSLRSQKSARQLTDRSQPPTSRNSKLETGNWKFETGNPKLDAPIPEARHSSLVTRHSAAVLRLRLVGANPRAKVSGLDELPGKSNYFIGNDPKKWRTNVANYAKVKYEEVYPGIDLVYCGKEPGLRSRESEGRKDSPAMRAKELEFDFVVAPGADPPRRTGSHGMFFMPWVSDVTRLKEPTVRRTLTLATRRDGSPTGFTSRRVTGMRNSPLPAIGSRCFLGLLSAVLLRSS